MAADGFLSKLIGAMTGGQPPAPPEEGRRRRKRRRRREFFAGDKDRKAIIRPRSASLRGSDDPTEAEEPALSEDTPEQTPQQKSEEPRGPVRAPRSPAPGIRSSPKPQLASSEGSPQEAAPPGEALSATSSAPGQEVSMPTADPDVGLPGSENLPVQRVRRRFSKGRFRARLRRARLPVAIALGLGVLASLVAYRIGESLGEDLGRRKQIGLMEIVESRRVYELPEQVARRLDDLLLEVRSLRGPRSAQAAQSIAALAAEYPNVASMHYAAAIAALEAGDLSAVEEQAKISISRGERLSDAHVLLSIVESQRRSQQPHQLVPPMARVKEHLAAAIKADPMNPAPRIELGSLLRYSGDTEGALRELRAARARSLPVDSHLSVDVTVSLMEVESLPTEVLQARDPHSDDPRALLPAALVALRTDNPALAAHILRRAQAILPRETFSYLVNDAAFRRYAELPEIRHFQEN